MPLRRGHWRGVLFVALLLAGRGAGAESDAWTRHSEAALAEAGDALTARVDLALAVLAERGEQLNQAAPEALPDAASAFAFLERTLGASPTLAGLPLGVQLLRGDEPLAWLGHPIPPDEDRASRGPALGSFGVYRFLSLRGALGTTGLDWLLDLPLAPRLPGGHGGLPTLLAEPAGLRLRVLPPEALATSAAAPAAAAATPVALAPTATAWRSGPSEAPGSRQGLLRRWTLSAGPRELLEIQLQAPDAPSYARARAATGRAWLGLALALLIVAIGFGLRWQARRRRPGGLDLPRRALFLTLWVLLLRLALRWGDLPGHWLGGRFWSARDMALDLPGGLLASPGEFLISALAALLLLVLVLRPYLRPEAERETADATPVRTRAVGALARGFALLAPLGGALAAWRFATWVYANSAPELLTAEGLGSPSLLGFDSALFLAVVFLLCLFLVPAYFAWQQLPERRWLRLGGGSLLVLALGATAGLDPALGLLLILPVAWGFRRAAARLTGLLAHAVLVILAATLLIEGAQVNARAALRAELAARSAGAGAPQESLWQPQQVEETLLVLGREPGLRRDLLRGRGGDAWLALAAWQSAGLAALDERGALELFDARGRLRSRHQQGVELPESPRRSPLAGERGDLSLSVQRVIAATREDSLRLVEGEMALVAPDGRPLGWILLRLREDMPEGAAAPAPAALPQRLLTGTQRLFLHLVLLLVLTGLDLAFSRIEPLRRRLPPLLGPHGLGFQHKLLGAFLAVALLPVLLTGLIASRQLVAEQDRTSLRSSLERVRAAQRSLENRVRQEARDLAASEYVRNFVVPDFPTTVRDIGSLEHNRLMIFNGAGELLLDESLRNWNPAQVDSFLAVLPVGRVVYEREGRRVHAGILTPMEIWHRERRVSFMVYYRLQVDAALLDGLGEVVGGELNLYSAGSLLYADRPELFGLGYQSPMLDPATVRALAEGHAGTRQDLARAGGLRLGRATLPLADALGRPLALLSSVEVAGRAGPAVGLGDSASLVFSMIALLMILALLLGSFLAGRVFLPIRRLQLAVRRLSAGDLGARLPAGGADEIGELMTSFNRMAEGLQATRSELEQRRRFLESVLENVASGVLAFDGAGRLVSANAAARRLLALGDEPLDGRPLAALAALAPSASGRDRGALFRHLAAHPGELRGPACELRLQDPEGARTLRLADADPTGERVVVFTDVSELIRSQKLAAWSEMARQVAHEIKNPLTPIKLSAQMMERAWRDRREDFDAILGESLASIGEQVEILRRIAQEFSQFGRRAELTLERVDLGGLLTEILAPYRDTLQVDWQGPTALAVRADREALRKVLLNLVENAREAMDGAGRLDVALATEPDGGGELSLRDHGGGIPEEALGRLFEPYFSTKTRGTGLGLAISAQLVEEMGGRLRLENHPGGGAVARLALPSA